ncbi:E3 ubiquitin-protein ligase RING1-like [Apostasia shenzhenica]|uniref:RING-type E3 ubiquitin transferase n=1 Tax=Apostasia shenzhenica TaxID=1088818 RepID=A0A2I0AT62_9ASPA|nr:E3 ubiquitin-protein ligase RING1-like [Apostasia shenzhenica]
MSSTAAPAAVAASAQQYFCHQCERTVSIASTTAGDPVCTLCGGGFVEELEPPNQVTTSFRPGATNTSFASTSTIPLFSASGGIDIQNPSDVAGLFGPDISPFRSQASGTLGFNPQHFIRDRIQSFLSGGATIHVVFDSSIAGGVSSNLFGSGLEHLLQQLFENDPNRYGTPPAAKSAVEALPTVKISEELIAECGEAHCAVCKDAFEVGAEAVQIPCRHIYHKDCIVPWLELHNSCPLCRYELPTDDPDYEQPAISAAPAPAGQPAATGDHGSVMAASVGREQPPLGRRAVRRMIRILLPWPSRGSDSQAEASNEANDGSSGGSRDDNVPDQCRNGYEDLD